MSRRITLRRCLKSRSIISLSTINVSLQNCHGDCTFARFYYTLTIFQLLKCLLLRLRLLLPASSNAIAQPACARVMPISRLAHRNAICLESCTFMYLCTSFTLLLFYLTRISLIYQRAINL